VTAAGCAYDECMRYAQRGGYTPAEQQRRERVRLQAAERFARDDGINEIAHDLWVMPGSVRRWRRAWQDGGTAALRSRGPVSRETRVGSFSAQRTPDYAAGVS
jgi:transposase-like protein